MLAARRKPAEGKTGQAAISYSSHFAHASCIRSHPVRSTKSLQFNKRSADPKNTMWCKQCQQDVPGVATADGGRICCLRCGQPFVAIADSPAPTPTGTEDQKPATEAPARTAAEVSAAPPCYDGWDLDEQLRHIERVLEAGHGKNPIRSTPRPEAHRLDPPHGGPPAWHITPAAQPARRRRRRSTGAASAMGALAWIALSLGTMSFLCGAILLGWSLVTGRQELWTLGLPITLGGQIALLVGLVFQLDRLWHDSRHAAAKLDDVDEQLHELKTATTLLGTAHHSPSGAFYSHLVGGASPELLLNDLKSQLDLLAIRITQEE